MNEYWTSGYGGETRVITRPNVAVSDPQVISYPERRRLRPLPSRLRQVQTLAREGFTVAETARALGISVNTVKVYRASLLRRGGLP